MYIYIYIYIRGLHKKKKKFERESDEVEQNPSYFSLNGKLFYQNLTDKWEKERKDLNSHHQNSKFIIDFSKLDLGQQKISRKKKSLMKTVMTFPEKSLMKTTRLLLILSLHPTIIPIRDFSCFDRQVM